MIATDFMNALAGYLKVPVLRRSERLSWASCDRRARLPGPPRPTCLTLPFAVLEAFAPPRLPVFLALSHARVAREQSLGFQGGPQMGAPCQQSPRKTGAAPPRLAI